jgi:hypothetical protein
MFSYYRTLFDISSQGDDLFGLDLMRDIEEVVRTWVQESFPEYPEILEDPQNAGQSRKWERANALLRLSGGTTGNQGYFWLRWHVEADAGNDYQRYLGFRLATEGNEVQADVEVRVGDRSAGHFDDEVRKILENLLSRYRCSTLGTDLSLQAQHVRVEHVDPLWQRLSSGDRCLPVVMVSEKRGGEMPLDGDLLQSHLLGLATVACCPDDVAWNLGWHSWRLLCYDGQVRVYAPHLDVDDDELRHRSWTSQDMDNLDYHEFLQSLRDECSQKIHYPNGRDALRVFSRVRERVRARIRAELSQDNRQLYDEWAEEVSSNEDEIKRWQELYRRSEDDNQQLRHRIEQLISSKRALDWRLHSSEGSLSEGYAPPAVFGKGTRSPDLKTVADVLAAVKDWVYVRVFRDVERDSSWIPKRSVLRFHDLLASLEDCGPERITMSGMPEVEWMREQGISFAGRESVPTMNQYGNQRRFKDDKGEFVEMQPHISVGQLRVYLRWSQEESRWLVGYFGKHLPIVSQ